MQSPKGKISSVINRQKKSHAIVVITFELLIGVIFSTVSFFAFYVFSHIVTANHTLAIDMAILELFISLRTTELTNIMLFFSFLGGDMLVIGTILVFLYLLWQRKRQDAIIFSFAVISGLMLNLLIKALIARPRPELTPVYTEILYSFPSGHAMNSFIFYTIAVFFIFRYTHTRLIRWILAMSALVLVGCIGLSRIYLGVHYPSDVVAGFIAGFWWIVVVLLIEKTLELFEIVRK